LPFDSSHLNFTGIQYSAQTNTERGQPMARDRSQMAKKAAGRGRIEIDNPLPALQNKQAC